MKLLNAVTPKKSKIAEGTATSRGEKINQFLFLKKAETIDLLNRNHSKRMPQERVAGAQTRGTRPRTATTAGSSHQNGPCRTPSIPHRILHRPDWLATAPKDEPVELLDAGRKQIGSHLVGPRFRREEMKAAAAKAASLTSALRASAFLAFPQCPNR